MNKTIFGLALLAYAGTAQAQGEGTLRIKGQLTGFTDTVLVLRPATRSLNADTTMVTDNGTFDITIKLDKPQSLYLATPGTIRREQNAAFGVQVIGVPGESVELSGDPRTRYDINGSTFYKQYHEADIAMETAQKPINDIYKEYRTRLQAGESQEAVSKDLNPKMEQAQKDYKDAILDFIRQHPDYEASAAIIQQLEELGLMEQAAGLLSESVREGRMKDFYGKAIAAARQAKEAGERAEKLQGQRLTGAEWIQRADRRGDIPHLPADVGAHACGVKECSGFAESSAGCKDDAGHDRSDGRRQHDLPDGLEVGRPQCKAAFFEAMRQCFQRIVGGRSDKRQRQDGHRQSACEEVPLGSNHDDKDQVAKKADHDRRERG